MRDEELLNYAVNECIIDIDQLQSLILMKERQKYIDMHQHKIWQGKNGRWSTYLPMKNGSLKRVVRVKKEKLEDEIYAFYKENEQNPTIQDLYSEWIHNKLDNGEISKQTVDRYDRQFNACDILFRQANIKSIEEYDIECFLVKEIKMQNMTQKSYSNLRTIIYGIFRYAKKRHYVSFSITEVINDMEISRRMFRKNTKDDSELVFSSKEKERIESYVWSNYKNINDFGILLLFKTGIRPGELSALKWCDLHDDILEVRRTEIRYSQDGENIFTVRDFPKTEAGIRKIVLPDTATCIIEMIRRLNPTGQFMFEIDGIRQRTYQFDQRLETICNRLSIKKKSMNKIRKTYATILLDNNVDESFIRKQMGHTDISTTKSFYYKDRKSDAEKMRIINSVQGL